MKSSDDPVTLWIDQLRAADDSAAHNLWNHFVSRLYDAARKKLSLRTRSLYNEEDAAQSAFQSVCAGIAAGRFSDLSDRDSLLRLMLVITSRKISRRHRFDQRQQRDVRRNASSRVFANGSDDSLIDPVNQLPSHEPTPEFAAEFAETCESLYLSLNDPELKEIVALRMEGYTDSEVADRLNCSLRTVQRSREVIRRQWNRLEMSNE